MPDLYFLIFGLVTAFIGFLLLFARIRSRITCRTRTEAAVSSVKTESTVIRGSTVHTYRPVLSYTVNGRKYKEEAPYSSVSANKYRVGDVYPVFIDENHPEQVRFPGRPWASIVGLLLFAVGMLFVVLFFF